LVTISTSPDTPPGYYALWVYGKGSKCNYDIACSPGQIHIAGKPVEPAKISCAESSLVRTSKRQDLWWFNGVTPQPENYVTTLEASPAGAKDYTWNITGGQNYAQFSNGTSTDDTKGSNTVKILPKGDPGPTAPAPIVSVTVTVTSEDGSVATSSPFQLTVRRPNSLQLNTAIDHAAHIALLGGYTSLIKFSILDQTGEVLPQPVDTSGAVYGGSQQDFGTAGTNVQGWRPAAFLSVPIFTDDPADYTIIIDGAARHSSVKPEPSFPCQPVRCDSRVIHQSAYLTVGSQSENEGVQVATFVSQNFTDHGRVCNLVSPSPQGNRPANPGNSAAICPSN